MTRKPYTKDHAEYVRLVDEMYDGHPPVTLSPEYGFLVEKDMMTLLIRLARYKFVSRQLKATDKVLEIGCGSGLGAIFMGQHCQEVLGLDVFDYEITDAERVNRRDNVSFLQQDFFDFESPSPFDVIVLLDVIEHMAEETGRRLIKKTATHLAPDGMLIVGTPSVHSLPYQSPGSQAGHVKCYDKGELVDMIEDYYGRALAFSMNDEMVHTGYHKLAWYYFTLSFMPKRENPRESE